MQQRAGSLKINKTDKPLARLTERKPGKTHIKNQKWKKLPCTPQKYKESYKNAMKEYATKFNNLEERISS